MEHSTTLFGIPVPSDDPLFLSIVIAHIFLGIVGVVAGAIAIFSRKGLTAHKTAGKVYFFGLLTLFISIILASIMQWPHDLHLLAIGTLAFAAAYLGRSAAKKHVMNWPRKHTIGMGVSFILLITGFYVDNGKNLPFWNFFPQWVFWVFPSGIGIPLIVRTLYKHPLNKTRQ